MHVVVSLVVGMQSTQFYPWQHALRMVGVEASAMFAMAPKILTEARVL